MASAVVSAEDKWARFDALQKELSSLAKELKKEGVTAPRRVKKERDPALPPREANAWVKQTQRVRVALTGHYASNEEELKRSRHPICITQVSKMIPEEHREALPLAVVLETYAAWKANPPPVKERAKKASAPSAPASETASVAPSEASAAPSEKKARKPRGPMTEEAKAAMAAKRAATLAAKKGVAAPAPAAAPSAPEVAEIDLTPVTCVRDFGEGRISAEVVNDGGVEHFLDASGEQMGQLDGGRLVTDGERPEWA